MSLKVSIVKKEFENNDCQTRKVEEKCEWLEMQIKLVLDLVGNTVFSM